MRGHQVGSRMSSDSEGAALLVIKSVSLPYALYDASAIQRLSSVSFIYCKVFVLRRALSISRTFRTRMSALDPEKRPPTLKTDSLTIKDAKRSESPEPTDPSVRKDRSRFISPCVYSSLLVMGVLFLVLIAVGGAHFMVSKSQSSLRTMNSPSA